MEYQFDGIPGFESRKVIVQPAGFISGAKLLVDGEVIKNSWGKYTLRCNDGTEVQARLQSNLIDPVPQLLIDGKKYSAVTPLAWYELLWSGWPIALVFFGAIGAIFGVLAAYSNSRIFRSNLQPVMKYVTTALVSIAAVILYLIVGVLFVLAINR